MKWSWKHSLSAAAVGLLLAACGGGGPTPTTGAVEGTLTRASAPEVTPEVASQSRELADIVPGQIFVAFERGRPDMQFSASSEDLSLAAAEGFAFTAGGDFSFRGVKAEQSRAYPTRSGLALYQVDGLDEAGTRALVDELRATSSVRGVFPNWILEAQQVAVNDPVYGMQAWHYDQLNLPAAWAIETGDSNAVQVAVLDAGAFEHPDLEFAAVGANFVGWAPVPGDEENYQPDPTEGPIDNFWSQPGGTDHGLHVAGTIAALANNEEGGVGVNWDLTPTHVKVLGAAGSGSFAGIIEGVYWAAGYEWPEYGTHINPNPARVINMSLGGLIGEVCPPVLDELFSEIYDVTGTITIVAAGNDSSPSDPYFPSSCASVIAVGATGPTGARASYSDYGAYIDVMAPGGDANFDHPLFPDDTTLYAGILSTRHIGGTAGYGLMQGTSMAAPHVTGVVSLMLARYPDLTLDEVRERLLNASRPLTLAECNVPAAGLDGLNLCGAGLLDAEAALLGEDVSAEALTAIVYAVPYAEEAPDLRLGDLASLEALAAFRTTAEANADGSWHYELTGLPAGNYLIVGLELRQSGEGIGMMDRFGTEEVTVVVGATRTADVEVLPVWTIR